MLNLAATIETVKQAKAQARQERRQAARHEGVQHMSQAAQRLAESVANGYTDSETGLATGETMRNNRTAYWTARGIHWALCLGKLQPVRHEDICFILSHSAHGYAPGLVTDEKPKQGVWFGLAKSPYDSDETIETKPMTGLEPVARPPCTWTIKDGR